MESEIQVNKKRITVVVLGDIGRSPRMQYHALSLAKCGLKVNIVGYLETPPIPLVLENADITITQLSPLAIQFAPKLVQYFLKAIWQFTSLVATLFLCGFSDYLLCQNPPAIPTLPACWIYCLIMRSKFIIDWHNYAYSIMALNLKQQHLLVKISKIIEQYFGSKAHRCLCVTLAMKNDLENNWNIRAKVLYDRPPDIFRPISLEEKHNLFSRLSTQYKEFDFSTKNSLNLNSEGDASKSTAFTTMVDFKVRLRRDRPALLFSSTSWTADEDFSILLDALQVYESSCVTTSTLPRLICVITGKGPMKDHYVNLIAQRNWKHVKVITPWLEAIDYPKMVASADLGVCLHTSSSGLDLPMKVVDMFGAGLPVCAYRYPCLSELVKENVNGYTFADAPELSMHILKWFDQFPVNVDQNAIAENMKLELKKFQESRWDENWNKRAKEFFT